MLYKNTCAQLKDKHGKSLQLFLETLHSPTESEKETSNVVYLDIIDEYADNKDTILHVLAIVQEKLQIGGK